MRIKEPDDPDGGEISEKLAQILDRLEDNIEFARLTLSARGRNLSDLSGLTSREIETAVRAAQDILLGAGSLPPEFLEDELLAILDTHKDSRLPVLKQRAAKVTCDKVKRLFVANIEETSRADSLTARLLKRAWKHPKHVKKALEATLKEARREILETAIEKQRGLRARIASTPVKEQPRDSDYDKLVEGACEVQESRVVSKIFVCGYAVTAGSPLHRAAVELLPPGSEKLETDVDVSFPEADVIDRLVEEWAVLGHGVSTDEQRKSMRRREKEIGQTLNELGGIELMRSVAYKLINTDLAFESDFFAWHGIGDWQN